MKRRTRRARAWSWFDEVYKLNFILVIGATAPENRTALRRALPRGLADRLERDGLIEAASRGRFVHLHDPEHGDICAIWLDPTARPGVVAHEAFHAVCAVARERRLELKDGSEEAFAYYLEWLVRNIADRVDQLRGDPASTKGAGRGLGRS